MNRPKTEKLIDQLVTNTRTLLEDHWKEAERVFGSSNIKISMAHLVDFGAQDANAKTTIAFGTRIKDTIEMTVPDGQALLIDSPQKPKRRPPKPQPAGKGE